VHGGPVHFFGLTFSFLICICGDIDARAMADHMIYRHLPRLPENHLPSFFQELYQVMPALNKNNSGQDLQTCAGGGLRLLTCDTLAVKRIMQEARELANDPCTDYSAAPLEVRHSYAHSHIPLLRPYNDLFTRRMTSLYVKHSQM
jgi:hypothetical protein